MSARTCIPHGPNYVSCLSHPHGIVSFRSHNQNTNTLRRKPRPGTDISKIFKYVPKAPLISDIRTLSDINLPLARCGQSAHTRPARKQNLHPHTSDPDAEITLAPFSPPPPPPRPVKWTPATPPPPPPPPRLKTHRAPPRAPAPPLPY